MEKRISDLYPDIKDCYVTKDIDTPLGKAERKTFTYK
jgi:hypothetical protein